MSEQVLRPSALRPGDRVAVVTPSSPVRSRSRLDAGLEVLRGWGLDPFLAPHALKENGHLAGSDEQRAGDLNAAFRDPSVRAVWASRGGYGVTRILHRLDWAALAADPKLLVGFSDVSALLLAAWQRVRLVSIHGQFVGRLGLQPRKTLDLLRRLVTTTEPLGPVAQPADGPPVEVVVPGTAEGRLVGGNLALIASLVGTPDMPDFDGAILFLEDVAEAPYRIDRMLTQLRSAGLLDAVAGVIVGEFVACAAPGDRPSLSIEETVEACLGDLGVPVVHGLAIGHVDRQIPLPLGVPARIQTAEPVLDLLGSPCRPT